MNLIPSMRPDERRETVSAFVTLFAFMTGFALLETARDALFLASLPASRLAVAYLVIAVLTLTLMQLDRVVFGRFAAGNELLYSLSISAVMTWIFWALATTGDPRVFFALYIWTGIVATLVIVRFWTALGARFTVDQAKRLFAFIGSGSVLGAILGSVLARVLSELGPPHMMLFLAAAFFLASALLLRAPAPIEHPASMEPSPRQNLSPHDVLELVWSRPYLRRVTILVLTASVTFTLVDYLFKSSVDRLVEPAEMGAVFSSIYLGLHIASLAVQLAVVSRVIRRFGVNASQALVPSLLALAAGFFALSGGLALALTVKVIDGSLRHSLYRTTIELFFVPVTGELRARVKAFIDVLGQRGGQALASLAILALLALGTGEKVLALTIVATSVTWLLLALALKKHYLNVFRETLGEEITETRVSFPALDLASMETLLETLSDSNDRRVLAALDLLGEQGKTHVIPALVLYHPAPSIVLRALDVFQKAGRRDFMPILDRLADHPDPAVRAAILAVRASEAPSLWESGLSDPSAIVRAAALAGLVTEARATEKESKELEALVQGSDDEKHQVALALARALHHSRAPGRDSLLVQLARLPDPEARRAVIAAMNAHPHPSFVDVLIPLLADRALREEVRECLVAIGPTALERLGNVLSDANFDYAVRRRLPKTIGAFVTDDAAHVLLARLLLERDGLVRFKILSALGGMRNRRPTIHLDDAILIRAIDETMAAVVGVSSWRRSLESHSRERPELRTPAQAILVGLLRHKQMHALERVFRLLNLQRPNEDLPRIFRGLESSDRRTFASSLELVEHLVSGKVRGALLELIDDLHEAPPDEDDAIAQYEDVLVALLRCSSESLSALAAYHAGETGAKDLVRELKNVREQFSERHRDVVDQALERISRAPEDEVRHAR